MRRTLSNDIKARPIRFFFIFMIVWQVYDFINEFLMLEYEELQFSWSFVLISIYVILFFVFDNVKKVEYDDDYMYITGKGGEEKIPFNNLRKMNPSSLKFNRGPMIWIIRYFDKTSKKKSVRVTLSHFDEEFGNFILSVKKENKSFVVKRIMHPIDFDF